MNLNRYIILTILVISFTFVFFVPTTSVQAAPVVGYPVQVTQPDGTTLDLFVTGDEYYRWLHDADGYTIIRDQTSGYYVYAGLVRGRFVPTGYVVGTVDPVDVGLTPNLHESGEVINHVAAASQEEMWDAFGTIEAAPTSGTIENVVIFVRFSDQSEFTATVASMDYVFNTGNTGYGSMKDYYDEVSYGDLNVNSTFYPDPGASPTVISYQDSHPRSYYMPYDASTNPGGYNGSTERREREHTLVVNAVQYTDDSDYPAADDIDADGDGVVDAVTLWINGSADSDSDILWFHSWSLYSPITTTINGKQVGRYAFQFNGAGTYVLSHEMFHVLGAPDLYHYSYDPLNPVHQWDLMATPMHPPVHMGCYMKYKYGNWIDSIPELTIPGTYSVNPLTSASDNCYRIGSPYSGTEFFLVEFRKEGSSIYEASLPGEGLLVYRIDTEEEGNASGPPDEVYIYRPNGTTGVDGQPGEANFSTEESRSSINDSTNPSSFLTTGGVGGLNLCSIGSSAGGTISFTYGSCGGLTPPSTFSKSSPTNGTTEVSTTPTLDWSDATSAISYSYCIDETGNDTCDGSWTYAGSNSTTTLTSSLACNTTYEWLVKANNIGGGRIADAGNEGWIFTTGTSGDCYEDDDVYIDANPITSGVPQDHRIDPLNDVDWVRFTLTETSAVTLETTGAPGGDTYLRLYESNGTTQITANDDKNFGTGDYYSLINIPCDSTVPPTLTAGTYYVKVEDVWDDPQTGDYQLAFDATSCSAGDAYEDDDSFIQANEIGDGETQDHSILPAGDEDFVWFDLAAAFNSISLNTGGSGDTQLYLYDSTFTQIDYDDDGLGALSLIEHSCRPGDALPAGSYFAKVTEFGGTIDAYTLNFSTSPCLYAYLPVLLNPPVAPQSFGKTSPANGAGGQPTSLLLDWEDASGAVEYQYCFDNDSSGDCHGSWVTTGTDTEAGPLSFSSSTSYRWQVRAINGPYTTYANSGSMWTFTTGAGGSTIFEGFEDGTLPSTGWSLSSTNTSHTWGINSSNPHSGILHAYIPWDYVQDEVLLSPSFTTSGGTVSFYSAGSPYWCRDDYNNCDLEVWLVKGSWDAGSPGDDILLGLADPDWTEVTTYTHSTFNFTAYVSGGLTIKIGIRYVGDNGDNVSLDDITITY